MPWAALSTDNVVFCTWMDETDTICTHVGLGYSIAEEINNGEAEPRIAKNDAMYLQPVFSAIQVCTYTVIAACRHPPSHPCGPLR